MLRLPIVSAYTFLNTIGKLTPSLPLLVNPQWGFNQIIYRNITKITFPITFVNPFIALATPYNDDKDVSGNYLAGFAIRNLTNTDFKINQADVGLYSNWIAIGY